jgi:hypothetical protein
MAGKKWGQRAPFERMTSWFDHDFIADDFEAEMNTALDFDEGKGTHVVKPDLKDH